MMRTLSVLIMLSSVACAQAEPDPRITELEARVLKLERASAATAERAPAADDPEMAVVEAGGVQATVLETTALRAASMMIDNRGGTLSVMPSDGGMAMVMQSRGHTILISIDEDGPAIRMQDASGRVRTVTP